MELSTSKTVLFNIALLPAILVSSMLTYRLIELPARAWGRSVGRQPNAAYQRPTQANAPVV
jgi:peptidoglycan/LPS O-acetylase OafA/YrhL